MAHVKNTTRAKRKYGDKRQSATERNRKSKLAAAERHEESKKARTQGLVGRMVEIRTKDEGRMRGHVRDVVSPPEGAVRQNGQWLAVETPKGIFLRSRHRCKVV